MSTLHQCCGKCRLIFKVHYSSLYWKIIKGRMYWLQSLTDCFFFSWFSCKQMAAPSRKETSVQISAGQIGRLKCSHLHSEAYRLSDWRIPRLINQMYFLLLLFSYSQFLIQLVGALAPQRHITWNQTISTLTQIITFPVIPPVLILQKEAISKFSKNIILWKH